MQVQRRYRLGPAPHHAENRCNTLITFDKSHLATHECTAYTEDGASRSATTALRKGMPCVPHMDGIVVRAAVGLVAVVQALQLELAPGHTAASVDAVELQLRTALELLAERAGLAGERSRLAEHDRPDSSECGERQRGADRTELLDHIATVHGLSSGWCRAHRHTDCGAVRDHAADLSSRHRARGALNEFGRAGNGTGKSLSHEYEYRSLEGAGSVGGGGGGLTTIGSALDPIAVSSTVPSGPFNRRLCAQCHGEHRAAHAVAAIGRPNVATVTLDDGAADPQPEPGAILLARDKGLEQFGQ